ncbi:neural cell adhesion molecule 1-B-like [Acanthaster planci]|uniref:Neural cell adhesion molecule 1-B-like n=1 Tax=Acanthaster planci TaxID=133434 RepID=A0A8B8A3Y3_ACAPL|nr:neural cell adhesion molecule 1-B-like [Acanthaster planci]XP_022110611.1 neural cell adhesion molecule 1-B-like [Acanthaster planci]
MAYMYVAYIAVLTLMQTSATSAQDCSVDVSFWNDTACERGIEVALYSRSLPYCRAQSSFPANLTLYQDDVELSERVVIERDEVSPGNFRTGLYHRTDFTAKGHTVFECCGSLIEGPTDCLGNTSCVTCRFEVTYWDLSVSASPAGPVPEGGDVTLICIIDSYPSSGGWVQWQYSVDQKSSTALSEPIYTVANHSWPLLRVSPSLGGWYRCAGNINKTPGFWLLDAFSGWIAVQVHSSPIVVNENRTWVGANDGYTTTLECIIRGNPLPTVTWYGPNGITLTNNTVPNRVSVRGTISGDAVLGFLVKSQVTINPVETNNDYGLYRCRASNSIGTFNELEVELKETGKPEPPYDFRASVVQAVAITVTWHPGYNGGEELQSYYVNYREISGEFDVSGWNRRDPHSRSAEYGNLTPDTRYQLAVYATNKHGDSPYATHEVWTRPDTPTALGITVLYSPGKETIVITGLPQDSDSGTCLRLEGYDYREHIHVSLGLDLDCIQRDGELRYSTEFITEIQSRYCRDGLCGSRSEARNIDKYPLTSPRPSSTGPAESGNDGNNVAIAVGVCGGIAFLVAILVVCYLYKRHKSQPSSGNKYESSTKKPETSV